MIPVTAPIISSVLTVLSKVNGFEKGVFIVKNGINLICLVKIFYTFTPLFANIQSFS